MAAVWAAPHAICSAVVAAVVPTAAMDRTRCRVRGRPLERAHPAHRRPQHEQPRVDPERVGEPHLGLHHVAQRQPRKARTPRTAVRGVRVRGSGGALTAADDVGGDDEVARGVERPPGADERVPPAAREVAGARVAVGVRVPAERVRHVDGVVARLVELAPRLVREGHVREARPAGRPQAAGRRCRGTAARQGRRPGATPPTPVQASGERQPIRKRRRPSGTAPLPYAFAVSSSAPRPSTHRGGRGKARRRGRPGCRRCARCPPTGAPGRA